MTVEGGLLGGTDTLGRMIGRSEVLIDLGIRPGSKSGGPTIDVRLPDGTRLKVDVSQ
jgi:hypothetical protein